MNLYEFVGMTDEDQWNEFWDSGIHLAQYNSIDCSYGIYALHNFFVEVEFDTVSNHIIGKNAFVTGVRLDKYFGELEFDL